MEWMREKNDSRTDGYELIPDDFEKLTVPALKQIIKSIKEKYPQYRVDEFVKSKGHLALRLPPYQVTINHEPISFLEFFQVLPLTCA